MGIIEQKYVSARCDAESGNLANPTCGFQSPGQFDPESRDAVITQLLADGWRRVGKTGLACPVHARAAQ